MTKMTVALLFLLVSVSAAQYPGGLTAPHQTFDNSNPGTILDTPPFIPGYHNDSSLVCSDCHIMHASMQHNYGYDDSFSYPFVVDPPAKKLLKSNNALTLCLSCHQDKAGIPDVIGPDINGGTLRAGGHFGTIDAVNDQGHNLGQDPGDLCNRCHFGGEFHTAKVTCVDCHAPHGTWYYRNLQWASSPGQEPPIIAFINPAATGLARYQQANIRYGAPGSLRGQSTWREVTNICIDCHHTLIDGNAPYNNHWTNPDNDAHWNRHPGTNSEGGAYRPINGVPGDPDVNTDPANWVNGGGSEFSIGRVPFIVKEAHSYDAASIVAQNNEVFCLSCHSAHGSDNAYGLRWVYGSDSNGLSTAACRQCHDNITGNIP